MIRVSIGQGNRIHLKSPYDPMTVRRCKNVPGANWAKSYNAWTFPLTIESCLLLREQFGPSLRIERDLSDWFRAERGKRDALGALSGRYDAELRRVPEVAPALAAAFARRRYQRAAVRFGADARQFLIADDPGLGKTLEAIGVIVESGEPGPYLVVVSPKIAVRTVWKRAIERWVPDQNVVTVPNGRAERDRILNEFVCMYKKFGVSDWDWQSNSTWVVVHPEMLWTKAFWDCPECGEATKYTKKPTPVLACGHNKPKNIKVRDEHTFPQFFGVEWGAVIVDESDESLIARSGTPTQRRRGLELLTIRGTEDEQLKITASGTPWKSKPFQLWGTLNWLRPKKYSSKFRWIGQFWKLGGYTGWEIGDMKPDHEQMLWDSLKDIVIRRSKTEPAVAKDLPPKTYMGDPYDPSDFNSPVGIWLEMEPAQEKAYKEMAKSSAAEIDGGRLEAIGHLAEDTRLYQFASSAGKLVGDEFYPALPSNKFDYFVELLRQLGITQGEPTGKVAMCSQWTRMVGMVASELDRMGIRYALVTGDVSDRKREAAIDAINEPVGSDSPHVILMNFKAGGKAITIDTVDDMVVFDEQDADTMTQMEDRIHRVSAPRHVRYHYLRSMGTVDVTRALRNAEAALQTHRLLDGRRGVEYVPKVVEAPLG